MTHSEMTWLMSALVEARVPGLPAEALAEVFDRLIWCLADNGALVLAVRDEWLCSEDRARVEIALAINEAYPFASSEEMALALRRVAERFPDLSPRCNELVARRGTAATRFIPEDAADSRSGERGGTP